MEKSCGIDDLLVAAQRGDREAENLLFSQLRARILKLVQHRIWNNQMHASKIRQDAEDLTEEICLKILESYKNMTFQIGFMPWVFRIVWNKIGTYYRERNRKRRIEGLNIEDENLQLEQDSMCTEQLIETKELDGLIFQALEKMDVRSRDVIIALLDGKIKSYIAEQQKTTAIGTIYSHIHRCRSQFKNLLQLQGLEL